MSSYRDLLVWQEAVRLAKEVYLITSNFPKEEIYGLTSQMRRSSISIASNIAEGRSRGTRKDFVQFLRIALGSEAELETQIEIAKELFKNINFASIEKSLSTVMKMLHGMIKALLKAES
jgi:four helix bundle protein